jgi:membrane dipeptidase
LNKLDSFYARGARYLTLTWNNSTSWASSAKDETRNANFPQKGLNDFGKEVVRHMNELGMMVDISHVGEQTFWDAIHTSTKPVIASHSSVYSLCPHSRNLKDEQIKAIAKNGGVIQVNFNSGFIDSTHKRKFDAFMQQHKTEVDSLRAVGVKSDSVDNFLLTRYPAEAKALRAPFNMLLDHIDYIKNLVGVDYVGLGSDFDGIELPPLELDDVSSYPLITKALMERGYTARQVTKVLGGNIIRVLKANEVAGK